MTKAVFNVEKTVANLPSKLKPNTLYCIRVGQGFSLQLSDATGGIAHKLNQEFNALAGITNDLFSAEAFIRTYSTNTLNRPTNYGTCVTFSNTGDYSLKHGNFLHQFAFTTTGRIMYTQSVNGARFGSWRRLLLQDEFQYEALNVGTIRTENPNGYYKRWAKYTGTIGTAPTVIVTGLAHLTDKIIDIHARVVIDGNIYLNKQPYSGAEIFNVVFEKGEIIVYPYDQKLHNKPITVYIEYEN